MESSAFSNKIIKMKLMKLKVDEYHLCLLKLHKNAASCMSLCWKNQEITLFILIATQREIHQSKKAQSKNLVQAIY